MPTTDTSKQIVLIVSEVSHIYDHHAATARHFWVWIPLSTATRTLQRIVFMQKRTHTKPHCFSAQGPLKILVLECWKCKPTKLVRPMQLTMHLPGFEGVGYASAIESAPWAQFQVYSAHVEIDIREFDAFSWRDTKNSYLSHRQGQKKAVLKTILHTACTSKHMTKKTDS